MTSTLSEDNTSKPFLDKLGTLKQANPKAYHSYLAKYLHITGQIDALYKYYQARIKDIQDNEDKFSTNQQTELVEFVTTAFYKQQQEFFDIFRSDFEKVNSLVWEENQKPLGRKFVFGSLARGIVIATALHSITAAAALACVVAIKENSTVSL